MFFVRTHPIETNQLNSLIETIVRENINKQIITRFGSCTAYERNVTDQVGKIKFVRINVIVLQIDIRTSIAFHSISSETL